MKVLIGVYASPKKVLRAFIIKQSKLKVVIKNSLLEYRN